MAITLLERQQIEKVFIAFLNAAPSVTYLNQLEGYAGRVNVLARDLAGTDAFKTIYAPVLTNQEFAAKFVTNFVGATASEAAKQYVQDEVVKSLAAGVSRADTLFNVVVALQAVPDGDATFGDTKKAFENKVALADYYAVTLGGNSTDLNTLQGLIANVTPTTDVSTDAAKQAALGGAAAGQGFTLTNGTDVASANIFTSGLVYNPAGTDRVNALQNEDTLTGTGTNPTLNVTLGNANDNGGTTVTPVLKNIETINAQFTGNTTTLDVRFADSLKTLAVTRVTADAGNTITFDNINQPAANLTVANTASVFDTFNFNYTTGVLAGTTAGGNAESGTLTVSAVTAEMIHVGNEVGSVDTEGFETLTLNASGNNTIKSLEAIDLENFKISGSGNLTLVNTSNLRKNGVTEGVKFDGNGIAIGDGLGIRTIDASGFTGTLGLDISAAVQGHADPANSGQKYYATITGGTGNDTFWTNKDLRASKSNGKDILKGDAGNNTLKLIDANITLRNAADTASADTGNIGDVGYIADVSGITNLELRQQGGFGTQTVNFLTFSDAGPSNVVLRNENGAGASTFVMENIGAALASGGKIVLKHGVDATQNDVVKVQLADATGTNDTVALTVQNDLNTTTQYNYTLNTTAMAKTTAGVTAPNGKVENVTVNDNDTESNVVTLANAADHIGTVTLTGGVAGQFYKVNYADGSAPLVAATIDASGQASNLFLQTAPAAATVQTVKLGSGNDALLFANAARTAGSLDLLKGSETITDAGGNDVVTAIFSKGVSGKPTFTGVETFQTAATANVAMDLSNTGLTTLNLLSDQVVDGVNGANDQYVLGAGKIVKTSIITANGTAAVSTLNFAGSNEDNLVNTNIGSYAQVFNGVTLNATAPVLNVNINSQAVGLDNATHAEAGATSYTLGQLTSQGTTTMNIVVADELAIATGATMSATTTTIDNIWAKNLDTLNVTANGSVNLGTITGNATNNNQKLVDASAVKGKFTATDIALGDAAQIKIGNGGSTFSALGSAGKNVVITAGNGFNDITGTAQNDTITTGNSDDIVSGDRGDNVITVGAGNDTVNVKDGNNTINMGSGTLETVNINVSSANSNALATNVVTGNNMVATVSIDVAGNGMAAGDFQQKIAVGAGHDLGLNWLGGTIQLSSSTLDGRVALDANTDNTAGANTLSVAANVVTALTANSYLLIGSVDSVQGAAATVDLTKATSATFLDYSTAGFADAGANGLTIKGSTGNDAIVLTNGGANSITAGTGADLVVLSTVAAVDTINVGDGNSTLAGYDQYYNFGATDKLVLTTANIATATAPGVIADSGMTTTISGASQKIGYAINAKGLVTFTSAGADGDFTTAGDNVALMVGTKLDDSHITLSQAVSIINAKAGALNAAAFVFDANNDGDTVDAADGTFIVENTTNGTVIELVGVNAAAGLTAAAGAFTVA